MMCSPIFSFETNWPLFVITAVIVPIFVLPRTSPQAPNHGKANSKQVIEDKIAGLRPGRDTIEKAYDRFGRNRVIEDLSPAGSASWLDPCNHQELTVAFEPNRVIRQVRIQPEPSESIVDCSAKSYSRSVRTRMGGTGHGLVFRDRCERIRQVYGMPGSEATRADGSKELHQFVYRFDQGPQGRSLILEIACDSSLDQAESIRLTLAESAAKP